MSEHVERCGLQVADGLADFVADRILRTVLAKHSQFAMRRDRPLQINHGDLQALVCGRGWTMDAKKAQPSQPVTPTAIVSQGSAAPCLF